MERQVKKKQAVQIFWVMHKKKYLSFQLRPGYEAISTENIDDMWKLIHQYIEEGYQIL